MDGMDMGGMSPASPAMGPASSDNSTTMDMMSMNGSMYFFTGLPFTLLFKSWVIHTHAQLAGAWFACFFLAIVFQALQAVSARLDAMWARNLAMEQQSTKTGNAIGYGNRPDVVDGSLAPIEDGYPRDPLIYKWWMAFSGVDLMRAVLRFIMVCVAYLLMLAVMSFNVAIFFAVTVGLFVGTLFEGSYGHVSNTGAALSAGGQAFVTEEPNAQGKSVSP